MKSTLTYSILCLLFMLVMPAQAAVSITVNSNGGSPYADSSGAILTNGSVVRVGYFDLNNPLVVAALQTSNSFIDINTLFKPLAEGILNAGSTTSGNTLVINSVGGAGAIFGSITGIDATYIPTNADLAVWVFNDSNTAAATQWGIFSATTRVGANWDFPNDLGSSTLSTFEIDVVLRGTNTGSQFRLASLVAPVPEPGSLLLLLSATGLLIRRRRC